MDRSRFYFTAFALILAVTNARTYGNENGVVTPSDPFKFVGEPLTLNCNITNDDLTGDSRDLYFERENERTLAVERIDSKNIQFLSTKAVRLHLPSLELADDGSYACLMRSFKKPLFIGHQVVKVDYRPRPINNITCRVYNWERMTCNWTLGADYQYMHKLKVDLHWTIHGHQFTCPSMSQSKTSCTWDDGHFIANSTYIMILVVENRLREKSPQFMIDTWLHVEPAPVNNFLAREDNSTCITLTWNHSSDKERKKFFIAQYKWKSSLWVNIPLAHDAMKTKVCGLRPNTNYTFQIKVMPFPDKSRSAQRYGYASPWVTVRAKTRDDVPESSPVICTSCFSNHSCHDSRVPCRSVRIYWQEVPPSQRNGEIIGYKLKVRSTAFVQMTNVTQDRNYQDVHLPSSQEEYRISLRAGTQRGYSRISSDIFIPSDADRPAAPYDFLVKKVYGERRRDAYYLNWNLTKTPDTRNIVVLWCFGNVADFSCTGDINWITLSRDEVTHQFTPKIDMDEKGSLLFGIAREEIRNNKIYSSGINWASCIYLESSAPPSAPSGVHVDATPLNSGLAVRWDKRSCPKDRIYVTGYVISICETEDKFTCSGELVRRRANNSMNRYDFEGLKIRRMYMVQVWAESDSGTTMGHKSAPVVAKVIEIKDKENGVNKTLIIIVTVCGTALLLIFCLCIYCVRRYFVHRRSKTPMSWTGDDFRNGDYLVANMHVQNRPLPELPRDDPYYGLNACMRNLGSERTTLPRLLNGSIKSTSTYAKDNEHKRMYEDIPTTHQHQPLLTQQRPYEQVVDMLPLASVGNGTLKKNGPDIIMPYETPVSDYTRDISNTETLQTRHPIRPIHPMQRSVSSANDNADRSRSLSGPRDSAYCSHSSQRSDVKPPYSIFVSQSDFPPENEAPPPPPPSSPPPGELPSSDFRRNDGQDSSQIPMPGSRIDSFPMDHPRMTYVGKNPHDNHLRHHQHPGPYPMSTSSPSTHHILPPDSEKATSNKHNNLPRHTSRDAPLPNGYQRFAPFSDQPNGYPGFSANQMANGHVPHVDLNEEVPNSNSCGSDSRLPSDYSKLTVLEQHDGGIDDTQDSNSNNSMDPQTSDDYSMFAPTSSNDYTPHVVWGTTFIPNGHLEHQQFTPLPNYRNNARLNFPPPPSQPPPSSIPCAHFHHPSSETKV